MTDNLNQLAKSSLSVTKQKKIKRFILLFVLITLILSASFVFYRYGGYWYNYYIKTQGKYMDVGLPTTPQNHPNGLLYRTEEGLMVLDLNGTESEMGFAHGFLLGDVIKYSIEYNLAIIQSVSRYEEFHNDIIPSYLVRNSTYYSEEIEGIFAGAVAAGADRYVPSLQREWDVIDLWMLNTIQDYYQVACSGIGVWGSSSASGQTFIGRNLDFVIDENAYVTQLYIIMIFRGNSTPGSYFKYDIMSFSMPGIIGVISGFNSKGVWMHVDSSNGGMTSEADRTGVCLAIRRFLEKENGTDIVIRSQEYFLKQNIAHSVLLLVGSNNTIEENINPVFILEVRDDIVGYRGATNPSDNFVVVTNHERVNNEPVNCHRYERYINDFAEYRTTGDNKIDSDELLRSQRRCGYEATINAIQFFPSNLTFRIGYTKMNNVEFGKSWSMSDLIAGPRDPLLQTWFYWENF